MTGESTKRIEEGFLFGDSLAKLRQSEEYQDFISDGYKEEVAYRLELVSGYGSLPSQIARY